MSNQKNVSLPDEDLNYIEEEGLSASKLLQQKIQERRERDKFSQLHINQEFGEMVISLRDFPSVVDSKNVEDRQIPIPLYKNGDGKLVEEPPVYKDEEYSNEKDVVVWRKDDNDKICKVKVENWEEHRDISLIYTQPDADGSILLDPKRM